MHPLIVKTKKSINKTYLDKGCIRCGHNGLSIRVSPNSLDRAFNIMDSLIETLESKNINIFIKEDSYKNKTCLTVSGVTFEIDMYEKINVIKKKEKDQFGSSIHDYVPNGTLVLRIKDAPYETQSEWVDGKRHKLEELIDKFVDGLYKAVEREKELAIERQKMHEEYLKEEEAQKQAALEQEQFDALEKEATNWHRSKIIRSYVEAATAAYIQKNGKVEPGSEFDKWRNWANQKVDALDPLEVVI